MQIAVIEFARNVAGLNGANSTEFDEQHRPPGDRLPARAAGHHREGRDHAPRRLSLRARVRAPRRPRPTARTEISERHRHRYEVNNNYRELLMSHGLIVSGTSPDRRLVEMIELPDHPYFVGCQFHPEFKSRPAERRPRCSARSSPRRSAPGPNAGERPLRHRASAHPSRAVQASALEPAASAKPSRPARPARVQARSVASSSRSACSNTCTTAADSAFTAARTGPIREGGVVGAPVTRLVRRWPECRWRSSNT